MRGNKLGGISVHEWSHCMPGSEPLHAWEQVACDYQCMSGCKEENIVNLTHAI